GYGIGVDHAFGAGGGGGGDMDGGDGFGAGGGGGGLRGNGGDGGVIGGGGGGGSTDDHPDTGIFNGGQFGGNGGYGAGGGGAWYGGFDFYALGGNGGSPSVGRPGAGGGGSGLGGGVFVQDGGTLIITDGVTLSGNTVQAGVGGTADGGTGDEGTDGSAYGQDIFLRSGAALVFNVEGTVTIPNPIDSEAASGYGYLPSQSPVGGVTKNGGGLVVLTGTNTYTGPTWVDGGNLKLNGSVLGDVNVDINGTFSGNAIVNGNLFSLGTISPGNSIGTIHTTNLNLESTNNYIVELNSLGASDEIIASGFAVVNGAVIATPLDLNFTGPETYTIVDTATGVSGVFTSLTSTVPALMTLTYDPLDVELTFLPLEPIGLTENAADAADCFVTISSLPGTDASTVNAALMALSFDDIGIAFNQMSPAQFSGVSQAQLVNATLVRSTYTRHLDDIELNHNPCFWPETSVWVDAVGQYQNQNSSGQQFGYTDTTLGGTIGADYQTSNFVLGCAVSYTHDNFHWKDAAGNANVNSYYGGLYGRWNDEGFYVNVGVLGGQNKYKTTRHIHFGAIDRNADASHQGNQWLANIGVGYQVNSCDFNFQWTPYVNFDYVHLHERRYTECGAGILDLEINTKNASLFQGELGVLFTTTCCFCNGVFVPKLKLAYINQTPFYSKDYRASFEGSVCTFAGEGWNYERNLFAPSLALTYQNCCDSIDISLYYDAQLGNQYWTQGGGVQLEVKF
ncbi:MAG: autotransporter domain-containing protein, partial [Parachlamydiaceae bacterium]